MSHFWGHVGFRPEKNVCLPTQLGACSHPTGRSTVPYWCTIDVRTPWARHGVPTGPPGPRRDPTAARGPYGGPVRLIFIGRPRFGRPAAPIGAARAIVCLSSQEGHAGELTSSLGCANRSCGPPKPERLLLSGVRRCRRGPVGSRRGPGGPVGTPEGPV